MDQSEVAHLCRYLRKEINKLTEIDIYHWMIGSDQLVSGHKERHLGWRKFERILLTLTGPHPPRNWTHNNCTLSWESDMPNPSQNDRWGIHIRPVSNTQGGWESLQKASSGWSAVFQENAESGSEMAPYIGEAIGDLCESDSTCGECLTSYATSQRAPAASLPT